jgi:hypothetical protein
MALVGIKIMTTCLVYEYFLIGIQKELQILNTLPIHAFTVFPHSLKASNRLVLIMSIKVHPTICYLCPSPVNMLLQRGSFIFDIKMTSQGSMLRKFGGGSKVSHYHNAR